MTDEDNSQGTDAAEAFEAMCVELALLRRAVEGLAAERGAIDFPDYTETLGRMQKGVDATADRIAAINDVIARSPALAMTPEQMAQLKDVAQPMIEEWSATKKAPRHAAWLHEKIADES